MNIIAFASRKGGSGKSTLAAHLSAQAGKPSRTLLIDCDPQGSLTLWHKLRRGDKAKLISVNRGIAEIAKAAKREGYEWVFIDTPPNQSAVVSEAIRAATLVIIPARATVFDMMAVQETIAMSRDMRTPFAVVLNSAPPRRDDADSPIVAQARTGLDGLKVPVWGGQITNRTSLALSLASGTGVEEFAPESQGAAEISRLWTAIEKSVKAINGAHSGGAQVMHRLAA